jgi:putative thioredoxin
VTAIDVTEETFEQEVLERSKERPVVVDFWAEWCGPCHQLTPVLEREADARADRLVLAKVDIDANPGLAEAYRVSGIPVVKAFRAGAVASEFVGVRSRQFVGDFLDELFAPSALEGILAELRDSGELPEARETLEAGEHERALELLLAEAERTDGDRRDLVRRVMLAVFAELGVDDELSVRFRRRLSSLLF